MNRARPARDQSGAEAIEPDITVVAFVELIADERLAIAVRRQRVELARASVRAVAVGEFAAFDVP
jgi:hypothetical protein